MRETRAWVYDLPVDSLFWSKDAPGEPRERDQVLCRMGAGGSPVLQRVGKGLWWKSDNPLGIECSRTAQWVKAVCLLAGDGGGIAGAVAANRFGWAAQSPSVIDAVTIKPPPREVLFGNVRWSVVKAHHRRGLTWGEVTLIEAIRYWLPDPDAKRPWDYVLCSVFDHSAWMRMPPDIEFRADAFAEAIPYEKPTQVEALCRQFGDRNPLTLSVRLRETAGALRSAGY